MTDSVVLMTSEVVTNAVLHSNGGGNVRLGADARTSRIRVEVADGSSISPKLRAAEARRQSGRGMTIVDALAAEWGVQVTEPGKTVWFEVARS